MPNLKILYEDDDFVAIYKPVGLLTHPKSARSTEVTLLDVLGQQFPKTSLVRRGGIVHRLDRETSGALLVAKTNDEFLRMKQLFKDRKIEKTYLTIVEGELDPKIKAIDLPLRRSPTHRLRREVSPSGKQAFTQIIASVTNNGLSLVKISPLTGRTNQIRAHLAHIGLPLLYDRVYGASQKGKHFLLHAYSLSFKKASGEKVLIIAPIPDDMRDLAKENQLEMEKLVDEA